MNFSISQELKKTFHVHALRREANHNLTGRQWGDYQQLTDRCQKAHSQEQKLFNERLHSRVDQEYRKIMSGNAAKNWHLKPNGQRDDMFDRKALLEQADTNVRNRHAQRLARITQIEERGIETLLQRSSRENQLTDQSKDAFTRAAERRSGEQRRTRKMGEKTRPIVKLDNQERKANGCNVCTQRNGAREKRSRKLFGQAFV